MQRPPEIDRLISHATTEIVKAVQSRKYSEMWNSYIYLQIANSLLHESRWEVTETNRQLLASRAARKEA